METIDIKYTFEYVDPKHGQFNDTLLLDYDRYHQMTKEEIQSDSVVKAMKQEKIDKWLHGNDNPPPQKPPSDEAKYSLDLMIENLYTETEDDKKETAEILNELPADAPDWLITELNNFQAFLNESSDNLNSLRNG